jgi:hypothetical protein
MRPAYRKPVKPVASTVGRMIRSITKLVCAGESMREAQ